MDIVEMVLGGSVNKSIVSLINKHGGIAPLASRVKMPTIIAKTDDGKNRRRRYRRPCRFRFVGDVVSVNKDVINMLFLQLYPRYRAAWCR